MTSIFTVVYTLEMLHVNKINLFCLLSFEAEAHYIAQTGPGLIMHPRHIRVTPTLGC